MKLRYLFFAFVLSLAALSTSGCRLVFEPDVDAVARLFASMPTGETRVIRELCDGDKVCKDLNRMASFIKSDWYGSKRDFYQFEEVEILESNGRSYVHVKVRLPSGGGRTSMYPLVFEMERIKFRWHIYSVKGLDEFNRRAERERGIL